MPLLYSQISHGTTPLVDVTYPGVQGNFKTVTSALLPRITSPTAESKLSLVYDSYHIHHVNSNGYTYLAITDSSFNRALVFKFLRSIRAAFSSKFNVDDNSSNNKEEPESKQHDSPNMPVASIAPKHYQSFTTTLESLMHQTNDDAELETAVAVESPLHTEMATRNNDHSSFQQPKKFQPPAGSKLYDIRSNLDSMQPILIDSIDSVMNRGERLELLVDKAQGLEDGAMKFNRSARHLKQKFFLDNVRSWGMIIGCGVLFILFMYALFD